MRTPRSRWDAAWKALIEQVFHPWLSYFFPDVAARVDPAHRVRFLDTELQKIVPRADRGTSHVDRLVEVRDLAGRTGLLLIHLEIQSQREPGFPLRMLLYYAALLLRYGLPVTSLALLADGAQDWRPDRVELVAPGTRLEFAFSACKLLDLDPGEPTLGEPVLHLVVRAWRLARSTSGDAERRFRGKTALARALVQAVAAEGCDRLQAAASLRFLETVAALPQPLEEAYERERNLMMAMADLDILTYGEKKAFRKGRREGRQEGVEEGRLAERRLSARRMHGLGLDTETIAKALGVSPDAVIGLLDDPP